MEYSIDIRFWGAKNYISRIYPEFATAIISKVTIQISDKTYYRIFFTLQNNAKDQYEIKIAILSPFFMSLPEIIYFKKNSIDFKPQNFVTI